MLVLRSWWRINKYKLKEKTLFSSLARSRTSGRGDNMVSVFKNILKEDGPRGLYRGLAPNFLKVAPAVSISYVVYEHLRMSLGVI